MSNLVDHARRELALIKEDEDTTRGILAVIQAFADMGHSGGSAAICIPRIEKLLRYDNLSPLTNDPDEWNAVGNSMFQSNRNPAAFSQDGGKTYWLLSTGMETIYTSKGAHNGDE